MTVFAGSGTGWLSGRLSRLMALKAFDVHHLLFFKLPLVDKILDYTGPLREKIMTEVTIGKFILMHPVREADRGHHPAAKLYGFRPFLCMPLMGDCKNSRS